MNEVRKSEIAYLRDLRETILSARSHVTEEEWKKLTKKEKGYFK